MTVAPRRKTRPGKARSWTRTRERRPQHPMGIIAVVCAFVAWASVLLVVFAPYLLAVLLGGFATGDTVEDRMVEGIGAWMVFSPFIILLLFALIFAAVAFGSLGTALGVLALLRVSATRGLYRGARMVSAATIASLGALAAIVMLIA